MSTATGYVPPGTGRAVMPATTGQLISDEAKASFVIGIGLLVFMSAGGALWGPFGAGLGFFAGQALVGCLPLFHGAHGNPDVTLSLLTSGYLSSGREAMIRWIGQIIGWSVVVFAGLWFYGFKAINTGFGVVAPNPQVWYGWLIIMPLLLVFVFATAACVVIMRMGGRKSGFIVLGVILGVLVYFGGAFGTGINGMREIVPMFATLFTHRQFFWIPLIMGRVGAVMAGVVGRRFNSGNIVP